MHNVRWPCLRTAPLWLVGCPVSRPSWLSSRQRRLRLQRQVPEFERRAQAQQQLVQIEEIKKGDDVVTIGGIHGKVSSVEGDAVMLDIDRGVKVKIEKSAISLDFSKKTEKSK